MVDDGVQAGDMSSYRKAFVLLIVVQLLFFGPAILRGHVIFPHNNSQEVAGVDSASDDYLSNKKFSDLSYSFIPETEHHLHGNYRAWISTWNPSTQLGRPTLHLKGLGKSYLIAHVLSLFIDNPFILSTTLTLITVILTGIFCFLFLRELKLHPFACCAVAAGLSLGVYISYWLTFFTFVSTTCWTLCLLWLIAKLVDKRSLFVGLGIAFAIYSLLMTGYQQYIIRDMYLVAGFTALSVWQRHLPRKEIFLFVLILAFAVLAGSVSAVPAYLDMGLAVLRSSRLGANDDFFVRYFVEINSFRQLGIFLSQLFDAFWPGNPINPDYPLKFFGYSFTPLYLSLILLSFANGKFKKMWFWHAFFLVWMIPTIFLDAYLFMFRYMGFNLSPQPQITLGGLLIPGFVISAYAIDDILSNGIRRVKVSIALIVSPLIISLITYVSLDHKLNIVYIAICFFIVLGTLIFSLTRKTLLLPVLVMVSIFAYGFNMKLMRPLDTIHLSSPVIAKIREETGDGSRYALLGFRRFADRRLRSNEESLFKIRSIHSYDSVSPRNYHEMTLGLSTRGTRYHGRYFLSIDTDKHKLGEEAFSYTGVGLVVSAEKIREDFLKEIDEINGITFHKTLHPPILEAQISDFRRSETNQAIIEGVLYSKPKLELQKTTSFDDYMQFRLSPSDRETLLFVSQQYHPHWKAMTGEESLQTVAINNFYLGVLVPPGIDQVDLEFKPFVLWSWLPQIVYLALFGALLCHWVWDKRKTRLALDSDQNGSNGKKI